MDDRHIAVISPDCAHLVRVLGSKRFVERLVRIEYLALDAQCFPLHSVHRRFEHDVRALPDFCELGLSGRGLLLLPLHAKALLQSQQ